MARTASKKFKVIPNPELQKAAREFVPVFGSDTDLSIVDSLISLYKKSETVDNTILREGKNLTKKMKEILFLERGLIQSITSRNMDF